MRQRLGAIVLWRFVVDKHLLRSVLLDVVRGGRIDDSRLDGYNQKTSNHQHHICHFASLKLEPYIYKLEPNK